MRYGIPHVHEIVILSLEREVKTVRKIRGASGLYVKLFQLTHFSYKAELSCVHNGVQYDSCHNEVKRLHAIRESSWWLQFYNT
jgi:hypothetical protein